MIKALFVFNSEGHVQSFEFSGHALAGPYGQDIVCSAVSALSIGTVNSLNKVANIHPQVRTDSVQGGYLCCKVNYAAIANHDQLIAVRTLMDSCYQISTSIADNYSDFIKIDLQN